MAAAVPDPRPEFDEVAFERMYRRYVKDVYRYTLALLQNPADAEDVTQTTFLNAWRAYRRGVDPAKPHNWLIKIAHNAARTRYAVSARRPQEVGFDEGVHELPVPAGDASELEGVLAALAKLPFNQRAALVMRELEGRSYREIAEALEVSVSAVETLIFRARRSLRVHRSKLRALGAVQLPPSLATFFESGGGALVGGGAMVGSGLLAKAAVVLATGIAAGGMGFGAVEAADRLGSSREIADVGADIAKPAAVAPKTRSSVSRAIARSTGARKPVSPAGHAAKRVGRAHAHSPGTAAPASEAPTVIPVDGPGRTAGPAARETGQDTSPSRSTVTTSTVAKATPIVTSVLPKTPPAPPVPVPVEPPAATPLPPVPPLPPVDLPPPPKLP